MNTLTEADFAAFYDWVTREKDTLPSPLREAALKLLRQEERRRVSDTGQDRARQRPD
mgnify:CR=1 FL=1